MRKNKFLVLFCVILSFMMVLCGITGALSSVSIQPSLQQSAKTTMQESTAGATHTVYSKEPLLIEEGSANVISLTEEEEKNLIKWTSSNKKIAAVDSGGRVDALKKGTAAVTAVFADNSRAEYKVTVTDAEKSEYDGFSTCIIANTEVLEENKKSNANKNLYYIKVNRRENCVTVYTYDKNGSYSVPVRAMVCSCGENNGTITGDFDIYFKNEWHALYQNVYGHYVSGILGDYLFHSVPYYTTKPDELEVEEFNKLGTSASLGCVRMACADVKWIYENCAYNTEVTIYDDDSAGPLGKPPTIKITDKKCGWDPTDDNVNNPYYNKKPKIKGAADCTVKQGDSFYPLGGISAVDTCLNDITDKIKVTGNVVTSREGTYKVTYYVEDAMHRSVKADITVKVTK